MKICTNRTPRSTSRRAIRQPRAVFARLRLVEAVHRLRGLRFVRDVEGLLGGRLHAGGQFVAGDAGLEVGLAGMPLQVPAVELREKVEILLAARRPASAAAARGSKFAAPAHGSTVAWNRGGIQPFDQLRTPSTGMPPGSGMTT